MRDSANDAFFTAESLENLSEALVREGIENSLDAAQRSNGNVRQVRVRISIVPSAPAGVRSYLANLFGSARQNFERGLSRPNLDSLFGDDCGYLVFEDFGTRGLTGDVDEWRLERSEQNAFFSFFRAEGRSPVVEDPPVATLLGDSEGVGHTEWQKDSPLFHNRYEYGPEIIKFVSRSVYEIMQKLHAAKTKGDPNLLLDIFYLPVDEHRKRRKLERGLRSN